MKNLLLALAILALSIPLRGQKGSPEVSRFLINTRTGEHTPSVVDTALTGSQHHLPLRPETGSWSELGNTGLPALKNEYHPVREPLSPLLFESIDPYGQHNPSLAFYSARSPFSLLNYNSGGASDKNGQTIRALFAKNLKRQGNITVLANYNNADGHFNRQKCNSSDMRVNYILNRANYSLVTGLSRNSFKYNENGGLAADDQLTATSYANLIPVGLSSAAVELGTMTLQGIQQGTIRLGRKPPVNTPPSDSTARDSLGGDAPETDSIPLAPSPKRSPLIIHSFRISNVTRLYTDASTDSDYYKNTFSDTKASADSIKYFSWTNTINLASDTVQIGKHPVMLEGGINPDFFRYLNADTVRYGFSLGLNGNLSRSYEKSRLEMQAGWTAVGYAAGDYRLEGSYFLTTGAAEKGYDLNVKTYARGASADPILRNFDSNHFRWANDFRRQHELGINASLNARALRAGVEAGYVQVVNRIYFDTLAMPAQLTKSMSVFSLKAMKEFKVKAFRSSVTGLIQYSTSDIIRLPLFVVMTSTFMHHDITFKSTGGMIEVEYGLDLTYTPGFRGYAYMPATGVFYPQNERVLGNYPLLNVFAQMKVKRTRLFVQWCHTFADLMPQQSFSVLHYPSMRPHLKYGIYWHFYD